MLWLGHIQRRDDAVPFMSIRPAGVDAADEVHYRLALRQDVRREATGRPVQHKEEGYLMTSANTTTGDNTQNQSTEDNAEIDELITLPFLLLFVVMLLLLLCVVSSASFTPALILQA
jgi:hypothetical protein